MGTLLRRVWYLLRHRRHDVELAEEIEAHRAMAQEALERNGAEREEAARLGPCVRGQRPGGDSTRRLPCVGRRRRSVVSDHLGRVYWPGPPRDAAGSARGVTPRVTARTSGSGSGLNCQHLSAREQQAVDN